MLPTNFDLDRDFIPSSAQAQISAHYEPFNISLEIKVNSLEQSLSQLSDHTDILIFNQQSVLRVLATMTLPPYLVPYLEPLYNLFNLPIVTTDPMATDPLGPQPSLTGPQIHLSPLFAEAPASDVLPTPTPASATHIPQQTSVEQTRTLPMQPPPPPPRIHATPNPTAGPPLSSSSPPLSSAQTTTCGHSRHQPLISNLPPTSTQTSPSPTFLSPTARLATLPSPPVSNQSAPFVNSANVQPPPPPPRTHAITSNPTAGLPLSSAIPPLSYAQAITRGNRHHQPPTSTSPRTSTQVPTPPTFQASILLQPSPTPLRTPQPFSSLIVQVQLSLKAKERPSRLSPPSRS